MEKLNEISELLQKGRAKNVASLVQEALDEGIDAKVILSDALLAGMGIVGEKFKKKKSLFQKFLLLQEQ